VVIFQFANCKRLPDPQHRISPAEVPCHPTVLPCPLGLGVAAWMASEVRLQLILGLEADLHGEIEDVIWLVVQ
jgi:hypothetical protein